MNSLGPSLPSSRISFIQALVLTGIGPLLSERPKNFLGMSQHADVEGRGVDSPAVGQSRKMLPTFRFNMAMEEFKIARDVKFIVAELLCVGVVGTPDCRAKVLVV